MALSPDMFVAPLRTRGQGHLSGSDQAALLHNRGSARYLEGIAKRRQILARMVGGIGQLRDTEVVRPRLAALVDAGIEVDEMPAGLAGGLHDQLNIALAVEGAGVADVAVIVDHVHDVGGLAPADPLEVNTERGADRTAAYVQR